MENARCKTQDWESLKDVKCKNIRVRYYLASEGNLCLDFFDLHEGGKRRTPTKEMINFTKERGQEMYSHLFVRVNVNTRSSVFPVAENKHENDEQMREN